MPVSMSASPATGTSGKTATVHRDPGSRKLRIGLFADSPLQPRWMVEAFAKVAASDYAEVVAVAEGCAAHTAAPWPWRTYGRVDKWIFGSLPDPSERIGLKPRLPQIRSFTLPNRNAGPTVIAAWRAEITTLRLDVAFALGDVD